MVLFGQMIRLDDKNVIREDGTFDPVQFDQIAMSVWDKMITTLQDWSNTKTNTKAISPVFDIHLDPRGVFFDMECHEVSSIEAQNWYANQFDMSRFHLELERRLREAVDHWVSKDYDWTGRVSELVAG